MLVNIQSVLAQYLWHDTIVGFGIKPDIATHEETAYVAYLSETNPGFVKCAIIENPVVMTESVRNGYFYGPLDIKVDQTGNPRIVYHDHNTEDLGHAQRLESNWQILGAKNVGHDGWDGSIYIDNQNRPHVVSIDPNGGLEYA
jgi:hypothetical protein